MTWLIWCLQPNTILVGLDHTMTKCLLLGALAVNMLINTINHLVILYWRKNWTNTTNTSLFLNSDAYKKLEKRYCVRGTGTYYDFEGAKEICSLLDGCVGIQGSCDGSWSKYEPCLTKPFEQARYNDCVWEKLF